MKLQNWINNNKNSSSPSYSPVPNYGGRGNFSTSWKFSLHIVYTFKKAWNFLTKFWYSDLMFSRNVFIPLCLKSEVSAHAQLAITLLYILLANMLIGYQLETYTEDALWKMGSHDDVMNVVTWLFLELFTMCAILLSNFLVVKQVIKLTFGRNKFDKTTVQNLQTRIHL